MGHVDQAGVVAACPSWDAPPQKSRRYHGLVDGPGRTKALFGTGQELSGCCARDYVRGELSGFQLECALV
jgi:hypothetical protein